MTLQEKRRIVSRINSRMRKTVDKIGIENREYSKFANRISGGGANPTIKSTTAYGYDNDGTEFAYSLISSAQEDVEGYSDEELSRLDRLTKTWSQVRSDYIQSEENMGYDVDSEDKMREKMTMRHRNTQAMEANADLWYKLLEEEGWTGDEAREKSTEEIYNALVKQREINLDGNRFVFSLMGAGQSDEQYNKYLQFSNARKIRQEMGM